MAKQRITQQVIARLKPPKQGHSITWDTEISCFGVQITRAGRVAFILDYRVNGRRRRYTFGKHPTLTATAARASALDLLREIRNGHDPLENARQERDEPTMGRLAQVYLDEYAVNKRPSSLRNDRQMIDVIIVPRLGQLRVKATGRRDIEALHTSLRATPYRANRVLALVSKMFSLSAQWGWRSDNPARGIPRFHEDRRERWLSAEELQKFSQALANYADQNAADSLRLLMLTGSREGEVLKAEWPQFDLQRGVWTKPSHHTKQKREEHIPLSDPAIELLKRMRPKNAAGPLFPGMNGARVTIRRPWVQVCKAAGLVEKQERPGKRGPIVRYRPTVRIHDLRHSFASHLVSDGISLHIVGKLLGHTQPQTTARYAHLQDSALRDATNRFGKIIDRHQ